MVYVYTCTDKLHVEVTSKGGIKSINFFKEMQVSGGEVLSVAPPSFRPCPSQALLALLKMQ